MTCWSVSAEAKPPFSATFSQYLKRAPCTAAAERCRGAFDHDAGTLRQAADQADRVQQQVVAAAAACRQSKWRDNQPPVVQAVVDALQVRCLAQAACCLISGIRRASMFAFGHLQITCECAGHAEGTGHGRYRNSRDVAALTKYSGAA